MSIAALACTQMPFKNSVSKMYEGGGDVALKNSVIVETTFVDGVPVHDSATRSKSLIVPAAEVPTTRLCTMPGPALMTVAVIPVTCV